jgi:hypothetical protein
LTRSDRIPSPPSESPLVDLPLQEGSRVEPTSCSDPELERAAPTASFSARAIAFAADAAAALFMTALALLSATRVVGQTPTRLSLAWAAIFAVYLSFFLVLIPLLLFGRTLGMALAGISTSPSAVGKRLTLRESVSRWLGTLCTVLTLGLPLMRPAGPSGAWTPADRLSGRVLVPDGNEES